MRYVFFGTPRFAEIILKKLIEGGMPPVALVCNPDKPFGRKKVITPPPTKQVVLESRIENKESRIKILQPEKLDADFLDELRSLNADFFVVAAYAKILPKELLDIPKLGVIGVHPSILPKYRGSSPIQSAILAGEETTGVSLYIIDEKVDHGPILDIEKIKVNNNDYPNDYLTLQDRLAELAGDMLIKTLPEFYKGKIKSQEQDHSLATLTRKFISEDGFIEYEDLKSAELGKSKADKDRAIRIDRKIKALNPEPGVYTIIDGKRVKLLESEFIDNKLRLIKIQKEGKKPQLL